MLEVRGGVDGRGLAMSPTGFGSSPNKAPVAVPVLRLNSGCWGGVAFLELSELVLAERSDIHILLESRSLSESSPLLVLFLRREDLRLNELERGLRWRFSSERWPSLGLRRLGRRRWWSMNGLRPSSGSIVGGEEGVGRSKAELEAGRWGLLCERAPDMI